MNNLHFYCSFIILPIFYVRKEISQKYILFDIIAVLLKVGTLDGLCQRQVWLCFEFPMEFNAKKNLDLKSIHVY
jgi:hypothetical protein